MRRCLKIVSRFLASSGNNAADFVLVLPHNTYRSYLVKLQVTTPLYIFLRIVYVFYSMVPCILQRATAILTGRSTAVSVSRTRTLCRASSPAAASASAS